MPSGVPAGGQFAAAQHAESMALLDDDDHYSHLDRPEPSMDDLINARYKGQPMKAYVQPQAWVNDYAVDTEPQVEFDIAKMLGGMPDDDREDIIAAVRDGDADQMDHIYLKAAEEGLVQPGYGPFYVEVDADDLEKWCHANPYVAPEPPAGAPIIEAPAALTGIDSTRMFVTPAVESVFDAEIANERNGGVTPATLTSTIDSISQGLLHDDPNEAEVLRALLVIRDRVPGDTEVRDLYRTQI